MADLPHNNPPVPSSSSSSSSSSSPTKVPVGHGGSTSGCGGSTGGSGESSSTKKRCHSHGASTSGGLGGGGKRKKGELIDVPKSEPICSLCGKRFGSWKGVFGHLRAHPERNWRGAFPPPVGEAAPAGWSPLRIGNRGDQQVLQRQRQLLAPTLLNFAQQTLARMRNYDIDLNAPPQQLPPPPPPPPPPQGGVTGRGSFDLNLPPPPENEEENDKKQQEKR